MALNAGILRTLFWWACRDSNPEPRDYESPALTVELQALEYSAAAFPVSVSDSAAAGGCFPSWTLRGPVLIQPVSTQHLATAFRENNIAIELPF